MDRTNDQLRQILSSGANELGLSLTDLQLDMLLSYQLLIEKWNRVYNLTAVRDPVDMVTQHLLDSLAVVLPLRRHLQNCEFGKSPRLLDVGSGGGLPGVVLAICCPDVEVTCIDAVAKKAAFVNQVAVELSLPNLKALHSRVEAISGKFEVICSRAFASIVDFVSLSRALLAPGGIWMAMKGKLPVDELADVPSGVEVFHVEQLTVPGLLAARCVVWMRPVS